jgi:hypothetical protein
MQGLQQSYTQYFNRAHGKVGHLFQGRYKAIVCEREEYLAALVRYIHLNPVRAGLVDDPGAYVYSGHRAYLLGARTPVIDPTPVLGMLGGRAAYRRLVRAEIVAGHQKRYYQVEDQQCLGGRAFAQRIRQQAGHPAARMSREPLEAALERLAGRLEVDLAALRSPDRGRAVASARAVASFVLVRRLGYRVTEVASALGRDVATISVIVSRLANRLESPERLAADVARLSRNV